MNKFLFNQFSVYSGGYRLYQYNNNTFRIVYQKYRRKKGFENVAKNDGYIPQDVDENVERASLSRSRRNIRELALSNSFEYFATLTINSDNCDRYSLQECQDLLRKKLKKIKRVNKNFAYIFITEKHKDGAFHFHGLVKGFDELYINDNGYYSNKVFDEIGFNSFSEIKNYNKTCNYILKYITKDCVKNENGTIYISSRGLKKADVYDVEIPFNIDWGFENEFVKIKDFNLNECNQEFLLNFVTIEEKKLTLKKILYNIIKN